VERRVGEPELSAVVMAFNERRTLPRTIEQLKAFCDEIIVVDDVSTDGTWEWLQAQPGLRAVQHRHTTFAAQREYGKGLAKGRWVLTMDADEYVTPELARVIRREISKADAPDGFYLRWKTPWPPGLAGHTWSKHPRLIRAEKCRWLPTDDPHSPLNLEGLSMRVLSEGHVDHEPSPDLASALRKSINRSLIQAAQARAAGKRGSAVRLVLASVARFLKVYWLEGAWRFGGDGLVWAGVQGFAPFTKYAFLIEQPVKPTEALQDGGPGSYPKGSPHSSG
jgi:glycosyltransferase involved in cell wall biosynthesis